MGVVSDLFETLTEAPVLGSDDYRGVDLGDYDTVTYKTLSGGLGCGLLGALYGNLKTRWNYQMPTKGREIVRAVNRYQMIEYGATIGAMGAAYALTDALCERYRGKADYWNSIYAGWAAGAVLGLRNGSVGRGLAAAASIAAVTAVVDTLAQNSTLRKINKEYLPFPEDR
ncbi:hypothetical protein SELMODRAFT_424215 [Selaginella moellendorffii]|uniref:Uncharacterized protein n=1 Tax=Selaginella moellendorffii TaxID=88036 RepID=D8SP65_SELML|nr:uncharacterized protein LOC9649461 [Selaginella moellendorffii]EFJ13615.1 hypothetical protein SELMODRAFT_424215 [Selaginella moellendorffii]|eukprot:XP_002985121.1 uncharacterized protein LOC9649461 [Selaginella moellendorffii]